MPKLPKRPRDLNQWDKLIVAMGVTGDKKPTPEKQGEDPCAMVRGGTGSLKGADSDTIASNPTPSRIVRPARAVLRQYHRRTFINAPGETLTKF
jgi:hypothetical protein